MKTRQHLAILTIALMTFGAVLTTSVTAEAGVGSTLKSSKKSGKRTHKLKKREKSSSSSKKRSSSNKSTKRTTKRTTAPRKTTTRKVASNKRVVHKQTTRTRSNSHTHRSHYRSSRPRHTHRTVRRTHGHHTHGHSHSHGHSQTTVTRANNAPRRRAQLDAYIRGGLGISALAAPAIADDALPGFGYEVALGAKGKIFGGELNFNGGGYTLDPEVSGSELNTLGLAFDLKVQPSIGIFEPFGMVGVGGYYLGDQVLEEAAGAAALRLGFGADVRFDNVAVGARYLWSIYEFGNDQSYADGVAATTESLSANVAFYF